MSRIEVSEGFTGNTRYPLPARYLPMLWLARHVLSLMPTTAIVRAVPSISSITSGSFILVQLQTLDESSSLLDSFPSAVGLRRPAYAVHIEPFTCGFIFPGLGTHAQHVAIRIFDLYFHRPRVIRGLMTNSGSPL